MAWAEPSSQEIAREREGLEGELAEAQEHLNQLQSEADEALQRLEESQKELDATREEVEETSARVDESARQLAEKRDALCGNMRSSYKTGLSSLIDILLGAKSYEDLVSRVYYLDSVSEARSEQIQEVNELKEELATQQKELEETEARLQEDVEALEAKTVEYEGWVYEAQEYRDGLDADVQRLLEQEEAARAAEEEAARKAAEEAARKAAEEEAARKAAEEAARKADEQTDAGNKDGETGEATTPASGPSTVDANPTVEGDPDRLIYIQWGSRPNVCWPVQGGSMSGKVECGSETLIMAAIILTGDYSITPDSMVAAMEAKYGTFSASQTYNYILRYIEEEYGVHHRSISHVSASRAREILDAGHVISAGGGCEGRDGLPFCKAPGSRPRCSHGHVVLFYKYEDGVFWAKDSAPGDGAAMCAYPDGPLTVTHRGAASGRCDHNGETASYDNYADAFFRNSWSVELWKD